MTNSNSLILLTIFWTFTNCRLSKGSEESLPREVCSGDILQFGVDVMENSKKVTHGCIITTLKLFLPDGKEAKASPTIMGTSNQMGDNKGLIMQPQPQDLYLLNQYIKEALAREQLLETKLAVLQRLVGQTEEASETAWRSLIEEDRLLTRVEILEGQLGAYSKSMSEDKLREEAKRLMEEKEEYQEVAKRTLMNLTNEKLEAVKRCKELERQLASIEDEYGVLKELYERDVEENKVLVDKLDKLAKELDECKKEAEAEEDEIKEEDEVIVKKEPPPVEVTEDGDDVPSKGQEEVDEAEEKEVETEAENVQNVTEKQQPEKDEIVDELVQNLSQKSSELNDLIEKCEKLAQENEELKKNRNDDVLEIALKSSRIENDSLKQQLEQLKESAMMMSKSDSVSAASSTLTLSPEDEGEHQHRLDDASKGHDEGHDDDPGPATGDNSQQKVQLAKVKERYAEVVAAKSDLETSLMDLESEVENLHLQTQSASMLALVPLVVLAVALIIAYLPYLSALFGTKES